MPGVSPNAGAAAGPTANTIDLVVAGAAGRMGTRIVACLVGNPDLRLVGALEAPSMSAAVTVAFTRLATMAKALGDEYDVEITETHHRFKKDAPSGTALRMAEIVAEALGRDLDRVAVYGRQGLPGERSRREIAVLSLRSGDVAGEHTVSFGTLGERLELTHRAHSRDTFARGALRAVRFVAGRSPGLYSMQDALGLA